MARQGDLGAGDDDRGPEIAPIASRASLIFSDILYPFLASATRPDAGPGRRIRSGERDNSGSPDWHKRPAAHR